MAYNLQLMKANKVDSLANKWDRNVSYAHIEIHSLVLAEHAKIILRNSHSEYNL